MFIMKVSIPIFLFVLLLSGCPKVTNEPGYNLGETIMLKPNQPVKIRSENIYLLLTEVKDSRCPKEVNCVRAGEAKVAVDFGVGDAVSALELEAKGLCFKEDGSCGESTDAQGYKVQLYNVYPYPVESTTKEENYTAKVMVTKQ
ncbi:MAG: hypothetical protein AAF573_06630 [Bacteroidota bacterium]